MRDKCHQIVRSGTGFSHYDANMIEKRENFYIVNYYNRVINNVSFTDSTFHVEKDYSAFNRAKLTLP